jgi:hypothetical protein
MRDMEARLKHVSFQAEDSGVRAPVLARLRARLADMLARLMQKGPRHV